MSQETPNPLDPFGAWRTMRDASVENLSKIMIDVVNSEAYSQVMSKWADAYFTVSQPFQKLLHQSATQVLTQFNMPTREDVTRLAERLTNIETRLDDLDAKLDEFQRSARTVSKQNHSATAREKQEK